MEQHIKTDLKLMVKEANQERLVSYGLPANVNESVTEEQVNQIASVMGTIIPTDAKINHVLKNSQVSYDLAQTPETPEPPVE